MSELKMQADVFKLRVENKSAGESVYYAAARIAIASPAWHWGPSQLTHLVLLLSISVTPRH